VQIFIVIALLLFGCSEEKTTYLENDSWEGKMMILEEFPEHTREIVYAMHAELDIPLIYLYRLCYLESRLGELKGTTDLGFMQLNKKYIPYFVDEYWVYEQEFNVWDDCHNIIIGCSILKNEYNYFQNWEYAFRAYNCGRAKVIRDEEPPRSIEYGRIVMYGKSEGAKYLKETAKGLVY